MPISTLVLSAALLLLPSLISAQFNVSFTGVSLQCCALIEAPMVFVDPFGPGNATTKFGGLGIDYLSMLEARTGFECGSLVEYNVAFIAALFEDADEEVVAFLEALPECSGLPVVECATKRYGGFSGFTRYLGDCSAGDGNPAFCRCDLGVGGFSRNSNRDGVVDFVAPFTYDSLAVIQRSEDVGVKRSKWFFFQPFEGPVWLAIVSVIAAHMFVSLFDADFPVEDEATENEAAENEEVEIEIEEAENGEAENQQAKNALKEGSFMARLRRRFRLAQFGRRCRYAFFGTCFAILDHVPEGAEHPHGPDDAEHPHRKGPTTRQRFLALLAILLGLFFVLSYEASLVNNLFSTEQDADFNTVDDFFDCSFDPSILAVPESGNTQDTFWDQVVTQKRRENGCGSSGYQAISGAGEGINGDKVLLGLEKLEKGVVDFFLGPRNSAVVFAQGRFCGTLTQVGEEFFNNTLSFVLPKNSNMTRQLSYVTLELGRQNKIPGVIAYGSPRPCQSKKERKLTWAQMKEFFFVAWGALAAFALLLLFSRLLHFFLPRCKCFVRGGGSASV